jgi:hypothetical protein
VRSRYSAHSCQQTGGSPVGGGLALALTALDMRLISKGAEEEEEEEEGAGAQTGVASWV